MRTVSRPAKGATRNASTVRGRKRTPAGKGEKPKPSWMYKVRYKNMAKMEAEIVMATSETPTKAGRLNSERSNIGSSVRSSFRKKTIMSTAAAADRKGTRL